MRKPRIRSLVEGGVVVLIGAGVLVLIPFEVEKIPGMETEMSPSFLPTAIALALIAAGGGMMVLAFLSPMVLPRRLLARMELVRVLLSGCLLLAYTSLFSHLGFVVTSALFMGIFAYLFGSRSSVKIALSLALVPVAVWLFFEKLFRIPLPHGVLF